MSRVQGVAKASLLPLAATVLDTVLFSSIGDPQHALSLALVKQPSTVLVVGAAVPAVPLLMLRHRVPTAAVVGMAAYAAVLTLTIGSRPLVTLLLALYTVAATAPFVRSCIGLIANLAAHALTVAYEASIEHTNSATVAAVATVFALFDIAAWSFGLRASSARRRERRLVESRDQLAAEAVESERLRIARELHDIVANAVTVIVMQAAGARPMVRSDPARVEDALGTIEQMAGQAVSELRRLLVVLRAVAAESESDVGERPRLADLDSLRLDMERAHLPVTISVHGDLGELDPSVDLAAYRIVQESLTNVSRHAGAGCSASVELVRFDGQLSVQVSNTGGGEVPDVTAGLSSSFGLLGLRERVSLLGGELETGPQVTGGWRVTARLPVRPRLAVTQEPAAGRTSPL